MTTYGSSTYGSGTYGTPSAPPTDIRLRLSSALADATFVSKLAAAALTSKQEGTIE